MYAGVYDGHGEHPCCPVCLGHKRVARLNIAGPWPCAGGTATAEWLEKNMLTYISKNWQSGGRAAESDITDAFLKARMWGSHTRACMAQMAEI